MSDQREPGCEGRREGGRARNPCPYTRKGIMARKANSGTLGTTTVE